MKLEKETLVQSAAVVSDSVFYPGRSGLKIAAFFDHLAEGYQGLPFVVMAPKYGETKKNNLKLAYFLAANGMNVLRFDHTCHVGESDGVGTAFTLPEAVADILASIDFLQQEHGIESVGLVGSSLSARTALRAAVEDSRVGFLVSVVGVVNFRNSLHQVYQEDVVASYFDGRKWGVNDVLGYSVDFENFLEKAIEANMHDLEGSLEDARGLDIPTIFFPAENDVWVKMGEVEQVAAAARGQLHRISGAMHEVRENAEAANVLFRGLVLACLELSYGVSRTEEDLVSPSTECLLRQNRAERMRLKRAGGFERNEDVFWSGYLRKFDYIKEGRAYRQYLELLGDLIHPIAPGSVILDAGCGNGTLCSWAAARSQPDRGKHAFPPVWVSADLTSVGLGSALKEHGQIFAKLCEKADRDVPFYPVYVRTDLNLCAADGSRSRVRWLSEHAVDTVVASLLLSYLEEPVVLLREFHRVLQPRGKLVISSMKPDCDLSGIYRDFVDETGVNKNLEPARALLSAAGSIRLKEEMGVYRFYSGEQLENMAMHAGFKRCATFRSFGDQAVVVRAEK